MKILLFGKNGQVGWELQRSLAPLGSVVALGHAAEGGLCGDFTELAGLARTVDEVGPDVVVNAAAYTAVDRAEADQDMARAINVLAPAALARAAHKRGAWMVHYSTDYVFDGSGTRPWSEADVPAPLNFYGQTKLDGERAVADACERHLILRTSWVYGSRGLNFVRTMLRLAAERERLEVVDDQFGAPTGADLLADVTAHALRSAVSKPSLAGVYHVAAAGEVSWHAYAQFVIAKALEAGVALKATPDRVGAVASTQYLTAAKRPPNSRLDTTRLRTAFDLNLPAWQQGVARMLDEIL